MGADVVPIDSKSQITPDVQKIIDLVFNLSEMNASEETIEHALACLAEMNSARYTDYSLA